jgi:hypothetical protein
VAINTVPAIVAIKLPDSASDPRLGDFEELAAFHLAQSAFGSKWVYAKALLVCHWLALEAQGGGSSSSSGSSTVGGIKSEKEGDLARSFNSIVSADDKNGYLKSTSFGAELIQLWRACLILPMTRRVGEIN